MPPSVNVEAASLIPKNPWVAVAVFGGAAVLVVVLLREFKSGVAGVTETLEDAPGNLAAQTGTGLGMGIRNFFTSIFSGSDE